MEKVDFRLRLMQYLSLDTSDYLFDDDLYDFTSEVLLPHKESIPKLYRYSPADYNNIRSLEAKELFLSEAGGMNDIFEGLSCEVNDSVLENLEGLRDIAYFKSFSEHKNDLLMWGHYGENYSGMCVEYDLRTIDNACTYHLFPVMYLDRRYIKETLKFAARELSELKYDLQNSNIPDEVESLKDIMPLFVCKSPVWKYEAEWRLVVPYLQMHCGYDEVTDGKDHAEHYRIDAQSISFPYASAVYLGPRMKTHIKRHIAQICNRLNIKVYETKLSHNSYSLKEDEYLG